MNLKIYFKLRNILFNKKKHLYVHLKMQKN